MNHFIIFDLEIDKHVNFNQDFSKMIEDILYYIKRKSYCCIRLKYYDEIETFIQTMSNKIAATGETRVLQATIQRANVIKFEFVEEGSDDK